jgi:hypothetical protein
MKKVDRGYRYTTQKADLSAFLLSYQINKIFTGRPEIRNAQ